MPVSTAWKILVVAILIDFGQEKNISALFELQHNRSGTLYSAGAILTEISRIHTCFRGYIQKVEFRNIVFNFFSLRLKCQFFLWVTFSKVVFKIPDRYMSSTTQKMDLHVKWSILVSYFEVLLMVSLNFLIAYCIFDIKIN